MTEGCNPNINRACAVCEIRVFEIPDRYTITDKMHAVRHVHNMSSVHPCNELHRKQIIDHLNQMCVVPRVQSMFSIHPCIGPDGIPVHTCTSLQMYISNYSNSYV